ncbi:MAG: V-type ATPase subunit [Clostridia bacterium]|nr:V-type ATPase subunit [Clostridia bacterium]
MAEDYTYAVARIRAKEMYLLNRQDLEQLLSCRNYEECIRVLSDKGFGDGGSFKSTEELLTYEREKTWRLISELAGNMSVFDVFLYPNDFHNLKAAVKSVLTDTLPSKLFIKNATVSPDTVLNAVKNRDYSNLPEHMRSAAEKAVEVLLKTGDGQECDIILDRASLVELRNAGRASKNEMIDRYAELTVALSDIKIAARANKTGKSVDFLRRALAPCDSLDIDSLALAASKSLDDIYEYLSFTDYADAASELKKSFSAFEKWCDNEIMRHIQKQKHNPFTVAPLAAYILARENEIKAVRMILSGKQNELDDNSVRERLRDLYV